MSLRAAAVRGVAWSAAQSWGTQLTFLVVFLILARLLEPEAFGLLAMGAAFVAVVQLFVDQGMGDALVQRRELDRAHLDTAFWSCLASGLVFMAAALALAPAIAGLFDEPRLSPVVRWLSLGFVIGGLGTVPSALLRRELAFRTLATRSLIAVLPGGLIGITMALRGWGVWSLVAQNLVTSAAGVALLWQARAWRPGFAFSMPHFRELFSFGGKLIATYGVNLVSRRGDDVVIGYFLGAAALGYYSVAYQILLAMTQMLTGVTASAVFPVFSRLQDDRERLRAAFFQVTKFTSVIAFPAFAGVAVLAPELLTVLFGPRWLPSAAVLRVLALIGILHSVYYFNATLFVAAGKPAWRFWVTLVNAVVNIVAFLIAVRWGIVGVAAAYVVAGYLLAPLPLWLLRRRLGFAYGTYLRLYAAPVAASVIMAAVVILAGGFLRDVIGPQGALAAAVALGIVSYATLMMWLEPDHVREWLSLARVAVSPRTSGDA